MKNTKDEPGLKQMCFKSDLKVVLELPYKDFDNWRISLSEMQVPLLVFEIF